MRGSADFKLCNASGNTFSIFTYVLYIYIVALITLLSFLSRKGVACSSLRSVGVTKVFTKTFALGKIFKKRSERGLKISLVFRVFFAFFLVTPFCLKTHDACAFFFITYKDDDDAYETRRSAVVVEEEVEEVQLRLLASSSSCCCFPTRRRRRGRSREKRRVVIEFSRFSEMSIRPTRGVSEN